MSNKKSFKLLLLLFCGFALMFYLRQPEGDNMQDSKLPYDGISIQENGEDTSGESAQKTIRETQGADKKHITSPEISKSLYTNDARTRDIPAAQDQPKNDKFPMAEKGPSTEENLASTVVTDLAQDLTTLGVTEATSVSGIDFSEESLYVPKSKEKMTSKERQEHEQTLRHFMEGRKSVEELEAGAVDEPVNRSIHIYTAEEVKEIPPHHRGKIFPHALIIGTRKGGTSALRDFLALHPHIKAPNIEPGFFFRDATYIRGPFYYRSRLPPVKISQLLVEKSAEYFHYYKVPERVYAFNSSMKIMLIVRDPFNRMVSDYLFMQRYQRKLDAIEKTHKFEELVINSTTGKVNSRWGCLKRSVYHIYFTQWLKYFPREQILVIDGDDFAENNPGRELQHVETFLHIHPLLTESKFVFNETKGFFCVKTIGCLHEGKGHQHPPMDPVIEKKVRAYFRPHNEKFYDLVGKDFGWL